MKKPLIILIVLTLIVGVGYLSDLVFAQPINPSGTLYFIMLHDTPGTFTDQALKGLRVNSAADAIEFYTLTATSFDPTAVDSITWSDNANSSNVWTFDVSGTDHTMTMGNNFVTFSGDLTTSRDLTVSGGDITLGTSSIFSGGNTASLNNIDALNATTEATIETAIDTLSNLTSIGTIGTGIWQATDVGVAYGGTGASTLGDGFVLLGNGTSAIQALDVTTDGGIIIGDGTTDPIVLDVGSSSAITILGTVATGVWQGTAVTAGYGGTGATTLTDGGVLLGSGTNAITAMSVLGDGAIIVGDNSTDPVALSAFSSSTGTLKHESGGLEADVSGYSDGIYGMASGATLDIDTIAEIETAVGGTNILTESEIDASSELYALMDDETGSDGGTPLLVFNYNPTLTGATIVGSLTISGSLTVGGSITVGSFIFTDQTPAADGEISFDTNGDGSTVTAGVVDIHDGTEVVHYFGSAGYPTGDNQIQKYDAGTNKVLWEADADTGGATPYDDIGDPDNSGLTTITFDNAELSLFTGDNDAAASFFTIQNSDADHTGGNLYLLDLDYSADDGDADADFIKLQDSGGVLMTIQEEGKIVMTPGGVGSLDVISATPSTALSTNEAVWNAFKLDGTALDPSGDDIFLCGVNVDMSGVVFGGTGGDIDGMGISMAGGEDHAIHISQGKLVADNTVAATAGAEFTIFDIRVHTAAMNANSTIHAIDVATPETPAGTVVAVGTHSNIEVIQQSIGTFSTPSQTEYAGEKHTGGTVWADGVDASEIFVVDDDEIYVGSIAQFSEIGVIMTTPGSKTVIPTFHYNTAPDTWTEFFPADDTDGFKQNGVIRWTLADISGSWTNNGDPGGADSSAGYWIKIIRTANADPGTPTPTTVKTGAITSYFWSKTGAIDVLSMEADTITEDGNAIFNAAEGGTFTGGLIANANLSVGNATTTAGVLTLLEDDDDGANFASFMVPALAANTVYTLPPDDGDNTEVLQTDGSGALTWVANAGSSTAWDDIADPDAAATVDFVTYTQTIDIGVTDTGGPKSGLVLDVTGLGVGTTDVIALEITTATDDDTDYIPIAIYDDSGTANDLLFQVNSTGAVLTEGGVTLSHGATITQSSDNYITMTENSDTLQAFFGGTDVDIIWSDGILYLRNNEDTDAIVVIKGKDAGEKGILRVNSDGNDKYVELHHDDTDAHLISSSGDIHIEASGGDINLADDNLTTTGSLTAATLTVSDAITLSDAAIIDQSANNNVTFTENSDSFQVYFSGTDLGILWSDGVLNFRNNEDGVDAIVEIEGKDAGEKGILRVLSDGDDKHLEIHHDDTDGHIITNTGDIHIEPAGGDTVFTGGADFGGADLELPQASPGVPDADGEVELDFTDGKMVIQHGAAHAELAGSTDIVMGSLIKSFSATIFAPDGVNDVITVKAINSIEFPHGVVITAVYLGISSNTNYVLTVQNFDDFDTINAGNGTIDTVTYTADTTGEIIDTTPTYATIGAGQIIMVSIPATDVDWIHFEIYYYEPAA